MFKFIYSITDKIKNKLNEKGQGMVEYAIVLAAVVAIAVAALWSTGEETVNGQTVTTETGLKGAVTQSFKNATDQINEANKNTKKE